MTKLIKEDRIILNENSENYSMGRYVIIGSDGVAHSRKSDIQNAEYALGVMNSSGYSDEYQKQPYEIFKVSDPYLDAFDMIVDTLEWIITLVFAVLGTAIAYVIPFFLRPIIADLFPYDYEWLALIILAPIPIAFAYWVYTLDRYNNPTTKSGRDVRGIYKTTSYMTLLLLIISFWKYW